MSNRDNDERFLSRWSRRKSEAAGPASPSAEAELLSGTAGNSAEPEADAHEDADVVAELPDIDALGKGIETRALEPGDIVAIGCAGAYGLTSSPVHFISHAPPREILLPVGGEATDITADGPATTAPDWSRFAD